MKIIKKLKLALTLMLAMPCAMILSTDSIKQDLVMQAQQLKRMLTSCNDAYICHATPMYEQSLTFHWYLTYFIPFRLLTREYAYNAEVLLAESKKLADVISTIQKIQESEIDTDLQINQLIKMLVNCNDVYMHNTPMYKQTLTLEWYTYLLLLPGFRSIQGGHFYNSEILLTESKNISDVIAAMIEFKKKQ